LYLCVSCHCWKGHDLTKREPMHLYAWLALFAHVLYFVWSLAPQLLKFVLGTPTTCSYLSAQTALHCSTHVVIPPIKIEEKYTKMVKLPRLDCCLILMSCREVILIYVNRGACHSACKFWHLFIICLHPNSNSVYRKGIISPSTTNFLNFHFYSSITYPTWYHHWLNYEFLKNDHIILAPSIRQPSLKLKTLYVKIKFKPTEKRGGGRTV